jgi:hypothetical protein
MKPAQRHFEGGALAVKTLFFSSAQAAWVGADDYYGRVNLGSIKIT